MSSSNEDQTRTLIQQTFKYTDVDAEKMVMDTQVDVSRDLPSIKLSHVSPDSTMFATFEHNTISVWSIVRGECLKTLSSGPCQGNYVRSCAFSPNSEMIVSSDINGNIDVWDIKTGERVLELDGHEVCIESCSFSPDSKMIVSCARDGAVKVWDAITGECLHIKEYYGCSNDGWIESCSFLPNSKFIMSNCASGTMGNVTHVTKLWELMN